MAGRWWVRVARAAEFRGRLAHEATRPHDIRPPAISASDKSSRRVGCVTRTPRNVRRGRHEECGAAPSGENQFATA